MELNIDTYFQKETDEREIQTNFNFGLINEILPKVDLFSSEEKELLNTLQAQYIRNLEGITLNEYRKGEHFRESTSGPGTPFLHPGLL